jgi:hypothetical protein
MHLWWQMLEQEGNGRLDRTGINDVVVVEDQDETVRDISDVIEYSGDKCFCRRWLRRSQRNQRRFSNVW